MKYAVLLLKIAAIVLLLKAGYTDDNSYEFYEMLRWFILGSFAYFSWFSYTQKNVGWAIFFILGILLFNPFKHAAFEEETWQYIDYAFALVLTVSIVFYLWNDSALRAIIITKKMMYKEATILSSCVVLLGVSWGFIALHNSYYEHKMDLERDKINRAQSTIDKLPTDYSWKMYNEMIPKFSEKYLVNTDTFVVSAERKAQFFESYPTAKKITSTSAFEAYHESDLMTKYTGKHKVTDPKVLEELNKSSGSDSANEIDWSSVPDVSQQSTTSKPVILTNKEFYALFTEYIYYPITWQQFQKELIVNSYVYNIPKLVNHGTSLSELYLGIGYGQSVLDEKNTLINQQKENIATIETFNAAIVTDNAISHFLRSLGLVLLTIAFVVRYAYTWVANKKQLLFSDKTIS